MCFPAMDNLQLGVFFGGGGKKKNSLTKGKKDRLITGWAMDYFFFMDLPFGGILLFQCCGFKSCQWWFANQEYMCCH